MKPRALVIDANNMLYRMFYGLPYLSAADGTPTNAVFGMLRMIKQTFDMFKPARCLIAWDGGGMSWRHGVYAAYKQPHRTTAISNARTLAMAQRNVLEQIIDDLGLPQLRSPGIEGDDVVSFGSMSLSDRFRPVVVSADHDFLQLVGSDVTVFNPMTVTWVRVDNFSDATTSREWPRMPGPTEFLDWMVINGDTGDGVPMVKGLSGRKRFETWSTHITALPLSQMLRMTDTPAQFEEALPDDLRMKFVPRFAELQRNWKLVDLRYALTQVEIKWPEAQRAFARARLWDAAQRLSFKSIVMEFEQWVRTFEEYHRRAAC